MAITLVQHKEIGSPTLQASLEVTLDSPATAGNLLVVFYAPDKDNTGITKPTGFSDAIQYSAGQVSSGQGGALFWKEAAGGEQVISASHDGGNRWIVLSVFEYSGFTSPTLDQSDLTDTVGGSAVREITTGPTATTTDADELAICFWAADSASAVGTFNSPSDSFVAQVQTVALGGSTSAPALQVADKVLAATGTPQVTLGYVDGTSLHQIGILATFKGATPAGTPLFLRPDADQTVGDWLTEGDGTPLYTSIDEATESDADYIKSPATPSADACRVGLSNPSTGIEPPGKVRYRYKRDGAGVINLTVRLFEGATEIAEWVHAGVSDSFVTATQTLTELQFDAITDFSNLFLDFEADEPVTRSFSVDPAVESKSVWDLDVDGPMTVANGSWTITPTAGFAGDVELWGPGGSSGGCGTSITSAAGAGSATTFSGLTANPGAVSVGTTTNTPSAGGAGGTASGGDVNTTGSTGGTGTVGTTSVGGDGAASPNGGATVAASVASGNNVSANGNPGNAPGGGAAGSARSANTAGNRRSVGGGGGGGYTKKTYSAGQLTAGTPITLTVSDSGAAGVGNQASGAKGAAGRAVFT